MKAIKYLSLISMTFAVYVHTFAQSCPLDDAIRSLKERKLEEKTVATYKTEKSFIVEISDVPLAVFAELCDVHERGFDEWIKENPNADTYAMFSCKYEENNTVIVKMYYKALNAKVPDKITEEDIQELSKITEELRKQNTIELENALVNKIMTDLDTRGVDVSQYNPLLYYCGSGAVSDPNKRNLLERNTVPQTANFACFIHDKQYLILGFDKGLADNIFKKNTFVEMVERGVSEPLAKDVSDMYYTGVALFGGLAYRQAQIESIKDRFGIKIPLPVISLPR
ncbi:MAG: hypothetical protein LBS54_00900 [Dysgonamonadaceae bacterium]|jgi:hypothetical protein|nr:hypothetical protein [Dysgonamonadaceae bacterium]